MLFRSTFYAIGGIKTVRGVIGSRQLPMYVLSLGLIARVSLLSYFAFDLGNAMAIHQQGGRKERMNLGLCLDHFN